MPGVQGIHHVALTVTDLARSAEWYEKTLRATKLATFELFSGHPAVLFACGPLLVGLHRDDRVDADDRFSEFRIGLDHLSFLAANRAEVEAWAKHLDDLGVAHAAIADAPYGHVLVFRDPDNLKLEFMAQPDPQRAGAPDDAPTVRGANHIGISVGDLDASADWYRKVFGDPPSLASMREEQFGIEYLLATPSSTVGLHWSAATPPDDRFSEFRCGLDHLAFGVEGGGAIEEWKDHLDGLGVSHSGVTETDYGRILVFRDPDNVQLELFATPS